MNTQISLETAPAELLEFSLAVQESLRAQLGDSLVDSARSILEMQRKLLTQEPQTASGRLPLESEKALLQLLAEIVLADGVVCSLEDEAAGNYILDHLAVDERDGERLLRLYEEAKNGERTQPVVSSLEKEDREAIFDACCKVAWADQQLQAEEDEVLRSISTRLSLDPDYARGRVSAYGEAVQQARLVQHVYTHVEVVQAAPIAPTTSSDSEWRRRSIQLLAIHHLTQKKGAKVSATDPSWCSILGVSDQPGLESALKDCPHLVAGAGGYILKAGADEAGKRLLQSARNEATLLRLLLGNGSPLTSRFLSFRINPPKPFPELELIRLAETSPALVRYGIGSGKWLGARAWGAQGAAQLVKEDWSLIKRDLKKKVAFSELEWEAIQAYAAERGETLPG